MLSRRRAGDISGGCAGIGRQARLRGVCQQTYGFKSHQPHHTKGLFFINSPFIVSKTVSRIVRCVVRFPDNVTWKACGRWFRSLLRHYRHLQYRQKTLTKKSRDAVLSTERRSSVRDFRQAVSNAASEFFRQSPYQGRSRRLTGA